VIITARQLEDLHKSNGHVTLPYRARLTPLAMDWVRARKITVGYSDVPAPSGNGAAKIQSAAAVEAKADVAGAMLWWCDGPCGPAKAAIAMHAKESALRGIDVAPDARNLVPAIRLLAGEMKAGKAAGGILVVQHAASAVVLANRCPSIRAIVGTSLEAVEQGIQNIAANVLLVEHPGRTLMQVKNLLSRFARAKRELSEEMRRQMEELKSCG